MPVRELDHDVLNFDQLAYDCRIRSFMLEYQWPWRQDGFHETHAIVKSHDIVAYKYNVSQIASRGSTFGKSQ